MKRWLPFLILMLCASAALADPPSTQKVQALVQELVLKPLAKSEAKRSRFSRAAPGPVTRRIRVLDEVALTDVRGKQFVRFAVDARFRWNEPDEWDTDAIVGCVYTADRKVFVKNGDAYSLPNDDTERRDVCIPAPSAELAIAAP